MALVSDSTVLFQLLELPSAIFKAIVVEILRMRESRRYPFYDHMF